MNSIIVSIGDELVLGQTVDTNSAWLSARLAAVGCDVSAHVTVPDAQGGIEQVIADMAPRCDVLLITGGLGPTDDDLTRQAMASVMHAPLEPSEPWLRELDRFFKDRGRAMPARNLIQAMIPRGAKMIFNRNGTAAGIHAAIDRATFRAADFSAAACHVFVMPGVPREMKGMFDEFVLGEIEQRSAGAVILSRTLHTFGLGESALAEKLGDLMNRQRNPSVGTTVSGGIVSLRINARFPDKGQAQSQLEQTSAACHSALGDLIFGTDEESLPQIVAEMLVHSNKLGFSFDLAAKQIHAAPRALTLATAESCTGGLLAKMLTDIPGSSAYFRQGWVTYSNEAKEMLLGVPAGLIAQFGAVSEAVVKVMANSSRARAKTDFALSISGIAGPDGGTPEKPVGTVCIGLASGVTSPIARTFLFPGDRETIRDRSAKMALTLLRYHLLGLPTPF